MKIGIIIIHFITRLVGGTVVRTLIALLRIYFFYYFSLVTANYLMENGIHLICHYFVIGVNVENFIIIYEEIGC